MNGVCKQCKKDFKKRRKTSTFCSISCQAKFTRPFKKNKPRKGIDKICECCKQSYYVPQYRAEIAKYCSRSCLAKVHLPQFSEFRFQPQNNPPRIYKTVRVNGKRIREHRYLMEYHVGRKLTKDEHVHHINGDHLDNRIENLAILSNSEHQKLEHSLRPCRKK